MLQSNRERYFFTAPPEEVLHLLEQFATREGGRREEGSRGMGIFRFADSTGGRRFLTASVRENDGDSNVAGNVTLRWRDEPAGQFSQLKESLEERLSNSLELLSLPEARKRMNDG